MRNLVIDASITIKWFMKDLDDENYVLQALRLLTMLGQGKANMLQPPHWLAEVLAVISRLTPKDAAKKLELLTTLEIPSVESIEIYAVATKIATELKHHLFDTLYHAVAICTEATFITADDRYFNKAKSYGHIQHLATI